MEARSESQSNAMLVSGFPQSMSGTQLQEMIGKEHISKVVMIRKGVAEVHFKSAKSANQSLLLNEIDCQGFKL